MFLSQVLLPLMVDQVLSIPISHRLSEDIVCWDSEKDGMFSDRSPYRAMVNDDCFSNEGFSSSSSTIWKKVWRAQVLPRFKASAWRVMLEALSTTEGSIGG